MEREKRWNDVGLIFYFALVTPLLLTDLGMKFASNLLNQALNQTSNLFSIVVPASGIVLAFFTSDVIGYLFNTIVVFFWNARNGFKPVFGGYSLEWKKLHNDFARELRDRSNRVFEERWKNYSPDVFLSYFWQLAPQELVKWVSRRHTVFFKGYTIIVTIVIALSLSALLIYFGQLVFTPGVLLVFIAFGALVLFTAYNAEIARTEAWQLIDLWASEVFDKEVHKAAQEIKELLSSKAEHSKAGVSQPPRAKPPYKVMRVGDVKTRITENDKRLFYFDNDVDIVATTISKKHVEPSHLHTVNAESYYVVSGKLLLIVDGQNIWLNEGDFTIVYPGVCHHFETTGEKVEFLAIKKETGLMDKQLC